MSVGGRRALPRCGACHDLGHSRERCPALGWPRPTARQLDVLRLIHEGAARGRAPTHRELAKLLGVTSGAPRWHLVALERKGFLTRDNFLSRGLVLTGAGRALINDGHCHACGQVLTDERSMADG